MHWLLTENYFKTMFVVAEAQIERALLCDRGLSRRDRRRSDRFAISPQGAGVFRRQRPGQVSLLALYHSAFPLLLIYFLFVLYTC